MNTSEENNDLGKISDNNDLNEEVERSAENINEKTNFVSSDEYQFGWSNYSEITNGRFAMLGFLAIILIELISKKSFLNWAGIF